MTSTSDHFCVCTFRKVVGDVIVVDLKCMDLDNNPLMYTLDQNPADGTFEIDTATNQLKVRGMPKILVCMGFFFRKTNINVNHINKHF